MKRWTLVPVFLGITLLALPNLCPAYAAACSPPDLMSYAVAGERDVNVNLQETCQVKGEASAVDDHIDAHRPAPHARKYIDGMRKDELLQRYPLSPDGVLPGKQVQITMDMEKPSA